MPLNESLHLSILEHGRFYVQEAHEEVDQNELRLLVKNGPGMNVEKFDHAMAFLSSFDESLTKPILCSLINYLSVYYEHPLLNMAHRPLWLTLLKKNESSRKVPEVCFKRASVLFDCFGISMDALLAKTVSPEELYSLGSYDKVFDFVDNGDQILYWRLKTRPEYYAPQEFLEEVNQLKNIQAEQVELLKARYVVYNLQDRQLFNDWYHFFDINKILDDSSYEFENPQIHLQLLNSLNFVYLHSQNQEMHDQIFSRIESILPKIGVNTHLHLKGIAHFHQAIISRKSKEKYAFELGEAIKWDGGFFDYFYRLADHFYFKGPEVARTCFEIALATSPITLEIVNDYGTFLTQHSPKLVNQFTELILGLGLFVEKDFNE